MWCAKEVNNVVHFFQHDDPIPEGSTREGASYWKNRVDAGFNNQYLKIKNNSVSEITQEEKDYIDTPLKYRIDDRIMTQAEKLAVDQLEAQAIQDANQAAELAHVQAQAEIDAQNLVNQKKQAAIEDFYNQYLDFCMAITGARTKIGFVEINSILKTLKQTDPLTAFELANTGLMLNALGQRLVGLLWWDSCPNE